MQKKTIAYANFFVLLFLAALLLSCSSGTSAKFQRLPDIPVTVASGATFAFDIASISGNKFYVTDRTNNAIGAVDIPTYVTGATTYTNLGKGLFAGCNPAATCVGADNSISGPDGNNPIGSVLYIGDVNAVKIFDPVAGTVTKTITVGTQGKRADEGCFNPDDNLFMINSPEEAPPKSTFINTTTQTIVATVTYADSAGLEACQYDSATKTFFTNNDGSSVNAHGEVNALTAADIKAIPAGGKVDYSTLPHLKRFPEGACDPTGLALGPANDLAVVCREGTTGQPLNFLIFDKTAASGTGPVATLNAGGGDQLWYDSTTNSYYNAAGRWTANGTAATNGACSSTSPCTPVLFVIDAGARTISNPGGTPIGNGAHSIAVDPTTGYIFVPYAASSSSCSTCTANGFVGPAIAAFKSR